MWYTTDLARVLDEARRAEVQPTARRTAKRIVLAERRRLRPAPVR
jgi:hypothetical protein